MDALTLIGAVIAGWAMLSLLGGERHRRLKEIDMQRKLVEQEANKPEAIMYVGSPTDKTAMSLDGR